MSEVAEATSSDTATTTVEPAAATTTAQTADTSAATTTDTTTTADATTDAVDDSPAAQYEAVRKAYGEKVFGDLTKKEAVSALKALGRYTTLDDALSGLLQAQKTISAGKVEKAPGKDAKPEQIAEWRQANGIPDNVDGYFEKLPDGLVVGDEDLPIFKDFAEAIHGTNAKPEVVHKAIEWYNKHMQDVAAEQVKIDQGTKKEVETALRAEYGAKYELNTNMANTFIANMFGEDQVQRMMEARTPDGKLLFTDPKMIHGFVKAQMELDPYASVIPGGGGSAAASSRLDALKAEYAKNPNEFYKDQAKVDEMNGLMEADRRGKVR